MLECVATTSKEKSERRNADSSTANATVRTAARAYTERRPTATHSRLRVCPPYIDASAPIGAIASARTRQARPSVITSGALRRAELGWALGDERVALTDEARARAPHRHDHLTAGAERIRDLARVVDEHRCAVRA